MCTGKRTWFLKQASSGLSSMHSTFFVKGNATAKSALSVSKKIASNAPARVDINKPAYAVVHVADMNLYAAHTVAASEAEAYYMHDALIKQNPALKSQIQVVSQFELN